MLGDMCAWGACMPSMVYLEGGHVCLGGVHARGMCTLGGGVCAWGRCMAGGMCVARGGHACLGGVCAKGGVCMARGYACPGDVPGWHVCLGVHARGVCMPWGEVCVPGGGAWPGGVCVW